MESLFTCSPHSITPFTSSQLTSFPTTGYSIHSSPWDLFSLPPPLSSSLLTSSLCSATRGHLIGLLHISHILHCRRLLSRSLSLSLPHTLAHLTLTCDAQAHILKLRMAFSFLSLALNDRGVKRAAGEKWVGRFYRGVGGGSIVAKSCHFRSNQGPAPSDWWETARSAGRLLESQLC